MVIVLFPSGRTLSSSQVGPGVGLGLLLYYIIIVPVCLVALLYVACSTTPVLPVPVLPRSLHTFCHVATCRSTVGYRCRSFALHLLSFHSFALYIFCVIFCVAFVLVPRSFYRCVIFCRVCVVPCLVGWCQFVAIVGASCAR